MNQEYTNPILKLNDIRLWLIENREEYQRLQSKEFPPFDNAAYTMYSLLKEFFGYYKFKTKCEQALERLDAIKNLDFEQLVLWAKKHEKLGSEEVLMFEINYIRWNERVDEQNIKIHEGLYTERKPFLNIICFCKVFELLYWDTCDQEIQMTAQEKEHKKIELQRILKNFYVNKK